MKPFEYLAYRSVDSNEFDGLTKRNAKNYYLYRYNTIQTVFLVRRLHLQPTEGALHSSAYSSLMELSSK